MKSTIEVRVNLVLAEPTARVTHQRVNIHQKSRILKIIRNTVIENKTEKVAANIKLVKEGAKVVQTLAKKKIVNQNTENTLVNPNILLNLNWKIRIVMLRIVVTER